MAELVIKIPEEVKNRLCFGVTYQKDIQVLCEALNDAITLPKGYGDLVDRDRINSRFNAIYDELESLPCKPTYKELLDKLSMCLDTEEPVIKANYE